MTVTSDRQVKGAWIVLLYGLMLLYGKNETDKIVQRLVFSASRDQLWVANENLF